MNSGATWTIADGGVSGKLWAGLHHDRKSARPHHSIGRARYCRRGGRVTACQMSHMGQKAKYSLRAHIVRFAPDSGRNSDIAGGPFGANKRLMHAANYILFDHLVSAGGMVSQR